MWTHWEGNILDALFDCFLETLLFLRDNTRKNFHQIPVFSKHDTRRAGRRTMTDLPHQVIGPATNLDSDSMKTYPVWIADQLNNKTYWEIIKTASGRGCSPYCIFFLPSSLEGHKNCEYAVDKPKFPGAAAVWADTGVHVCCCCSSSSFINQG